MISAKELNILQPLLGSDFPVSQLPTSGDNRWTWWHDIIEQWYYSETNLPAEISHQKTWPYLKQKKQKGRHRPFSKAQTEGPRGHSPHGVERERFWSYQVGTAQSNAPGLPWWLSGHVGVQPWLRTFGFLRSQGKTHTNASILKAFQSWIVRWSLVCKYVSMIPLGCYSKLCQQIFCFGVFIHRIGWCHPIKISNAAWEAD